MWQVRCVPGLSRARRGHSFWHPDQVFTFRLEGNCLSRLLLSTGTWRHQATVWVAGLRRRSLIITPGMEGSLPAALCWPRLLPNSLYQLGMTEGTSSLLGYLNCEQPSICTECAHELRSTGLLQSPKRKCCRSRCLLPSIYLMDAWRLLK